MRGLYKAYIGYTDFRPAAAIAVIALWGLLTGCVTYCTSHSDNDYAAFSVPPARGCKPFSPAADPAREVGHLGNLQTESSGGVTVTAAVLSDDESRRIFGLDLAAEGIQPVWIKIENGTDEPLTLLQVAADPEYYSPNEASYMNHTAAYPVNEKINEYMNLHGIPRPVEPRGELSGFLYARWDPAIKFVNVKIYGAERDEDFTFYFEIPGITVDYERVDFDMLYREDEIADYESGEDLHEALLALPCCTSRKDGSGQNDPLNFILIGDSDDIFAAFIRRGWDVTEPITVGSGWRAFKSFFSGARYRTSPMSSLYFMKRGQDIGLQKARSTIHERNHLRIWMLPMRYRGKQVWIGAVSRDVGSYVTLKTPWLTAHAIDPDLDEARSYLEQDMVMSGAVTRFGYVRGVPVSTPGAPERNFMSQPWYSDGLRAVMYFGDDPGAITEIRFFHWSWPGSDGEQVVEYLKEVRRQRQAAGDDPESD